MNINRGEGYEVTMNEPELHEGTAGKTLPQENEFNRHYDLTPLDTSKFVGTQAMIETTDNKTPTTPSYSIDPWEVISPDNRDVGETEFFFQQSNDDERYVRSLFIFFPICNS